MYLDKENKKSTIASLIFHALLLIGLISFKSAHILVPSRSDGIEVSIVSSDEVAPTSKSVSQIKTTENVRTLENQADINIKTENAKQNKPKPSKILQPIVSENTNANTLQQKAHKKKVRENVAINDLLNDIVPASQATGKGKQVAAKGGSGSSDTDNLISNYADLVINRVRPFVIIPDNIDSNAKAIIEVTLLPSMEVYDIKLIKSSGNTDYDNNIQQAIDRVRVFPPLPDGADFGDYKVLRLTFKPQ
jgi:colicin import membrane protein